MILEPLSMEDDRAGKFLRGLRERFSSGKGECREAVAAIIAAVRERGDEPGGVYSPF